MINQISKPAAVSGTESYRRPGLFWQDSTKSLILYSGDDYSGRSSYAKPYTIWEFTPSNGDGIWKPTTASLKDITWPRFASTVDTPSGGFVTGGFSYIPRGKFEPLRNMTIVGDPKTFTGLQNIGPFLKGGIHYGNAHFVPSFGTGKGMIVYIGGTTYGTIPPKRSMTRRAGEPDTFLSLSTIYMYDIASQLWYTQTAGGDVPTSRRSFCMTGARETNTNSYEM